MSKPTPTLFPVSRAAQRVPCSEAQIRYLDRRGIFTFQRDALNNRLLTEIDIENVRTYLTAHGRKRAG